MLGRILSQVLTGETLIDKGNLNEFAGHFLNPLRQLLYMDSVLGISWGHLQFQPMPQGIHRLYTLLPRLRLAPSCPARLLLSGLDCNVRLSRIVADGCSLRPWASWSRTRTSSRWFRTPGLQLALSLKVDSFPR